MKKFNTRIRKAETNLNSPRTDLLDTNHQSDPRSAVNKERMENSTIKILKKKPKNILIEQSCDATSGGEVPVIDGTNSTMFPFRSKQLDLRDSKLNSRRSSLYTNRSPCTATQAPFSETLTKSFQNQDLKEHISKFKLQKLSKFETSSGINTKNNHLIAIQIEKQMKKREEEIDLEFHQMKEKQPKYLPPDTEGKGDVIYNQLKVLEDPLPSSYDHYQSQIELYVDSLG